MPWVWACLLVYLYWIQFCIWATHYGYGKVIPYSFNSVQWRHRVTQWTHLVMARMDAFTLACLSTWSKVKFLRFSLIFALKLLHRPRWIGYSIILVITWSLTLSSKVNQWNDAYTIILSSLTLDITVALIVGPHPNPVRPNPNPPLNLILIITLTQS